MMTKNLCQHHFKHEIIADIMYKQSIFSPLLTYARYDVKEVIDLLVHSCGDDFDLWECVGHRMDSHFCHEQ